ncbi:MAG TPA: M28 family peptidase [Gemmatimonadaceae bacterium]
MRTRHVSQLLIATLLVAGCTSAVSTTTTQPASRESTAEELRTLLYAFSDDSMLGREAGQLGDFKATTWIAEQMRRIGLEPAGDGGTYFQTVPISIARLDTMRTIAVRGVPLRVGVDVLPFINANGGRAVPQGGSIRSVDGVGVVFGGQLGTPSVIVPPVVAGKVVVFTIPAGSDGRRDYRYFYRPGSIARYADAAGIAIASLDAMSATSLARARSSQEHIHSSATGSAPLIMLITPTVAARMFGVDSIDAVAVGTSAPSLAGGLSYTEMPAPYPARNVIGIARGSDPQLRNTYVAIGAHNDHIGLERRALDHDSVLANNMVIRRQGVQDALRSPTADEAVRIAFLRDSLTRAHGGVRRDSVNNGADDDGSGTVALLAIARRFAASADKPRRSLLFVSHTGEEKGLWGSQWFTDHPTVPRDSIITQLNMDMVGRGKATDIMGRGPNNVQLIGAGRLASGLRATIDSVNAARIPHMDIDLSFDANGHPMNRYCRSDHYMYARYGIPISYFSLGYHTDYHQVTDEAQYIDYDHLARIAGFVYDVARAVADRPQRFVIDGQRMDPLGGCRQ